MKRLTVVTGSRAEYGQLRPFLRLARESRVFKLQLIVAGMHLSKEHGETWREVKADGYQIAWGVPMRSVDPACGLGRGLTEFALAFSAMRPDLVLVEGDRVEALAAALAAGYMNIPLAHGGGGDVTGTVDNSARHAISHFSTLHFVSHEGAAQRLRDMGVSGEIHVTGALGIDAIMQMEWRSREETLADLGLPEGSRYLLVAFHPESGQEAQAAKWMHDLLSACCSSGLQVVMTYPNSDPGGIAMIEMIKLDAGMQPDRCHAFPSLGSDRYLHALRYADALVGNSSSGLYEAPSLRVPVVNVGHRQDGRLRAFNVQDCGYSYAELRRALGDKGDLGWVKDALGRFEADALAMGVKLAPLNPYGDGHAAERMLAAIERRLGE